MATLPIVNIQDKRKGIVAAILALLILIFILFWVKLVVADPPPQEIPVMASMDMDEIIIENLKVETGGQGGGEPSDDPVAPPTPQTQKVLTQKNNPNSKATTGNSKNNTAQSSDASSSSVTKSNNPFGDGGDDGKEGSGKGGPFGNDDGKSGTGPGGSGDGEGRVRLNDPQVDNIKSDVECKVNLKLTINADGEVVNAILVSKNTTTTDQRIINQVKAAVLNQVKYNKEKGAPLVNVFLTVKIHAT